MELHREIARCLLQIKAIKLDSQNPFTWASGRKSPIYCDNRIVLSHPEVRSAVQTAFVSKSKSFGVIDGVAGVATAGIAHGALLADRLGLPFIYIRSKAKEHGRQNQIEGALIPGGKYLVIEDLISTGGSSLQAVEALKVAGGEIAGVLAIFTYELAQAKTAFETANVPLETLSNYTALLEEAVSANYVNDKEKTTLQDWRLDPLAWSKAHL